MDLHSLPPAQRLREMAHMLSGIATIVPDMALLSVRGPVDVAINTNANGRLDDTLRSAMALARLLDATVRLSIGTEHIPIQAAAYESEDIALTALLDQVHAALVRAKERSEGR